MAIVQDLSEQFQLADQLSLVMEGGHIGYWDRRTDSDLVYFSPQSLEIVGLDPTKNMLLLSEWRERIHPDDRETMERVGVEGIRTRTTWNVEFRIRHRDGHWVWMMGSTRVVESDPLTGAPLRICGTHIDITARKTADIERENFFNFFSNSQDLMLIGDLEGHLLLINDGATRMLGFSREEFMQTPILDFVHPDDLASTANDVEKIVSQGGSYDHVNRYRHKDGGYRWLSWRSHYDKQNKQIFGVARDVTCEKEVEDALVRQEMMYRSLVEHSEDIISRFNRDLQIVYTNIVTNRYTPVHPDIMIGKTLDELDFPTEIPRNIIPVLQEVFETGQSRTVTFESTSELGNVVFHVHVFPEFSENNEVEFVFTVSRDITKMRRAEEEQQKIQNLSSLGLLAGGIAHDFNNILTILFGNITFAQSLAENGVDCSETLEKASQALKRATSLSTQLLTFAKGGDPVRTDVSLKELLEELVAFDLSGSNVNAVFDIADDLWMADVDMSLISQVFSNLAINADQAMPKGGSIYLSAKNIQIDEYDDYQMLLPGKYLEFVFRDEGTGIPASIREKVFDPYFTTKENGNGLGLATVYSIIKKHGGNILVESEVNAGTRFTFYLPASDILPKEKESSMQKETITQPGTGRILIMDDEPMILELVEKLLQSRGYEVVGCEDGREAITRYQESVAKGAPYDIVIMDLTIPGGMGGGEAIDALLDFDPQVKAVVSSGYASNDILSNYRDYGFVDYLPKPFTIDALMAVVQRHCSSV